jgi:hypothetical protein
MPDALYSHVIGVDDAPFAREHRGDVRVVGTAYAGLRLEGVLSARVRRDGANAARVLAAMIGGSRFASHTRLVLLQGIALAVARCRDPAWSGGESLCDADEAARQEEEADADADAARQRIAAGSERRRDVARGWSRERERRGEGPANEPRRWRRESSLRENRVVSAAPSNLLGGRFGLPLWWSSSDRRRRDPQTATPPRSSSDTITITLPGHPLRGRPLPLVRLLRARHSEGHADVEHPDGGSLRIPIEWTDRSVPSVVPQLHGRDVCLSVTGLQQLAAAVRAALGGEHDDVATSAAPSPRPSTPRSAIKTATSVAEPGARHAERTGRRLGVAGAQDPARSRGARGGDR